MRLNLLFGFLGSGKTTLARRILTERPGGEKMAVIVNEFGDVGIDGAILEGRNIDIVELTSGCLCCTLKGSMLNAVEELREKSGVRRVIIEATGVAQPEELIETFADPKLRDRYDIGPVVTVVDAPKYPKLTQVLGEFYTEQLRNADVLVLNKVDLASAAELEAVRAEIAAINPKAEVLLAERCELDIPRLLDGPSSRVVAAYRGAHGDGGHDHDPSHDHGHAHADDDHRHAPAQSFVLDSSGSAARAAVEAFFNRLPENVWRAKGFMQIDGQPSLVQHAMGRVEITPAEARKVRNIVFIGPGMDRAAIESGFRALLAGAPLTGTGGRRAAGGTR
ncbi:MAG: GTP-binding protein [Rhodospirillales bacterium]|nr:GTP-binding protein [Rhodospirillales bacterium]